MSQFHKLIENENFIFKRNATSPDAEVVHPTIISDQLLRMKKPTVSRVGLHCCQHANSPVSEAELLTVMYKK